LNRKASVALPGSPQTILALQGGVRVIKNRFVLEDRRRFLQRILIPALIVVGVPIAGPVRGFAQLNTSFDVASVKPQPGREMAKLACSCTGIRFQRSMLRYRTKYAIWWVTLACVLILPFETQIFSPVKPEHMSAPALRSAAASQAFDVRPSITGTTVLRVQPRQKAVWPHVVFSVWAGLLLWQILRIIRSYLYLRGIKKRATSAPISLADIALPHVTRLASVLLSREIASPAAAGFLHPAILLPQTLLTNLSRTEQEHVVLHETAHLSGYDDWANLALRTLGGALALHPVATWILRQIEREREIACDDWVVAKTGAARLYAECLVHLMELREEQQCPALAVGMFGNKSRLGSRVEMLMAAGRTFSGRASRLGTFASVAALGVMLFGGSFAPRWIALAQDSVPEWQLKAGGKMSFEVASVKLSKPGAFFAPKFPLDPGDSFVNVQTKEKPNGRFSARFPLGVYIFFAYKLRSFEQLDAMLSRLPKWVSTDAFEIQARGPGNSTKDQMRLMMQSLLAERFQLAVHYETHEVPVLAMTLVKPGKTGPGLRPHAEGPSCEEPPSGEVFPPICDVMSVSTKPDGQRLGGSRNTTMPLIAAFLSSLGNLDHPVIDQTGLTSRMDFKLRWTNDSTADPPGTMRIPKAGPRGNPPEAPPTAEPEPEGEWPPFLQALREQLGIKLVSIKGPIETLAIDHVERPSEN
jgi:bla regulator protein blaR1